MNYCKKLKINDYIRISALFRIFGAIWSAQYLSLLSKRKRENSNTKSKFIECQQLNRLNCTEDSQEIWDAFVINHFSFISVIHYVFWVQNQTKFELIPILIIAKMDSN